MKTPRPRAEVDADVNLLAELCETMKLGSLCAHGGAIPIPIASLMLHFRTEMMGGAR
jgi:formate dehydrogenase iron-sulfur subunit